MRWRPEGTLNDHTPPIFALATNVSARFAKAIRQPRWREIALAALDTAFYDVVPACDHSDQLRCRLRNDPISGTESSHSSAPATAWSASFPVGE
jgi:hypothetical protein